MSAISRAFDVATTIASSQHEPFVEKRTLAESMSLRTSAEAHALLLREAVGKLTVDCYETSSGILLNVDEVSGRILIPVPWSRSGRKEWGMPWLDAEVLRELMLRAQKSPYAFFINRWYLDLDNYPDKKVALAWVDHAKFNADVWLKGHQWWRSRQPAWKQTPPSNDRVGGK